MTHNEWESGKRLTIHNATKEQLKLMVEDRDAVIAKLYKELEEKQNLIDFLIDVIRKES